MSFGHRRLVALTSVVLGAALAFAPLPSEARTALLSAKDKGHYKNAFLHHDRGRYRDARLHAARAKDKALAKVIEWLYLTDRKSTPDYTRARAFFDANPDWPRREALQRAIERTMPPQTPDKQILIFFDANPPVGGDGAVLYVGALERARQDAKAKAVARKSWRELSFNREASERFQARHGKLLRTEDHVARLDRLLWQGSSSAARRLARRIGKGYPALADARIALANSKGGVDSALNRVPKHLRNDPGLVYDRAAWRKRKGRHKGVIALLQRKFPEKPNQYRRWWTLRQWAAREALDRHRYEEAYRVASNHGAESGAQFAEGEWLAGWTAFAFMQQPRRAYRHFSNLYYGSSSPISQARGAYWAGEASTALNKADWAKRWYEAAALHSTTFYGQLAARRLNRTVLVNLREPASPGANEKARFEKRELVRIVHMLGELVRNEVQETFLHHLRTQAETPQDYMLVADLAIERRRPDLAVRTAKAARADAILLPSRLFPMPFKPKPRGLETALSLAIIRQESTFNPRAISPAGARGLMQLMPATAKAVSRQMRIGYSKAKLTADPDYNMRLGQRYLADLLARFNGAHIMAVAGYNAGPQRVTRWIGENGDPRRPGVDPIQWIEEIPFSETRNYVMRVIESLVVYRARLNGTPVPLPLQPATAALPSNAN